MKTYYIYHIPEVKIGCSVNPNRRVKRQGYTDFEILEEHTDIQIASLREKELQKQYFGREDNINSYANSVTNNTYQLTNEDRSKGGKTQGRRNVESGLLKRNAIENVKNGKAKAFFKAGAAKTANTIYTCPYCGRDNLKGNIALGNHKKHCTKNGKTI